jgi:modulator of FtsH protease
MPLQEQILTKSHESVLAVNRVLRNTYLLLSLTLVFSAVTAYVAMITNAAPMNIFVLLLGYFGLLFVTTRLRNSPWGLLAIFAFTGFLGYSLGPILNFYIKSFSNGTQLVMTSLGATGVIFFGLSAYALTTKKDFSYLAAFLFVGISAAFILGLVSVFFHLPMLSLLVSCAFVLLSSGIILFQTSLIINGGERNYIMATITLYIALFNLFISLLNILSAFGGRK